MKFTAIIDGQPLEFEMIRLGAHAFQADIGQKRYVLNVQEVEPGVFWLVWNQRSIEVSVSANGEGYAVSIAGQRFDVELEDARTALRKAGQHGHSGTLELRAPMPGKIVKILVSEGAAVTANQGLLVIEAMKMQNEVKSPKAGIVRKIGVQETAAVNAGDLLAIVD